MLRNGRLLHLQSIHNLPDRPFLQRQIIQNLPPPWLCHRIESIRSCRRPCHASTIHSYIGICQELFSTLERPPKPRPLCAPQRTFAPSVKWRGAASLRYLFPGFGSTGLLPVAFKVGQVFLPVALAVFDFEYFYSLFKPSRPARHARPAREQLFPGSENTAQQSREAPGLPPRGTQSPAIVPVAQPPQNK